MTDTIDGVVGSRGETAPTMGQIVSHELQHEVEQFLYFEARLLDAREYRQWWRLLADDVQYWMPARSNRSARELHLENTGRGEIANFDDTKLSMEWRVRRLESGMAWTEDPPSRTRHLITNVVITPRDTAGEYDVESDFLVYRNRMERQTDVWVGSRMDVLERLAPLTWQIRKRTIILDQSVIMSNNLGVFF